MDTFNEDLIDHDIIIVVVVMDMMKNAQVFSCCD